MVLVGTATHYIIYYTYSTVYITIFSGHQKLLRFIFKCMGYEYQVLPFSLSLRVEAHMWEVWQLPV